MKNTITLLTILFITLSCSHQKTPTENISNASPTDQYWNNMASDSLKPKTNILDVLSEANPSLHNQIIADSKDPILPMFWGKSLNFDSGAKKKIVEDKIIAELQKVFNIKNDNMIVHAGIMHTYGYLFSTIDTPYGYKRKRWVDPTLNYAFNLKGKSLSPETMDGGMLSNITYFTGMLALSDKTQLNLLKNVSNEIFTFPYDKLAVTRVEERTKNFTLVTTLVKLPLKREKEENDYLLIYSINDLREKKEVLVTAFPVNTESFLKITSADTMGVNQNIVLRYNAYLEGAEKSYLGQRLLTKQ